MLVKLKFQEKISVLKTGLLRGSQDFGASACVERLRLSPASNSWACWRSQLSRTSMMMCREPGSSGRGSRRTGFSTWHASLCPDSALSRFAACRARASRCCCAGESKPVWTRARCSSSNRIDSKAIVGRASQLAIDWQAPIYATYSSRSERLDPQPSISTALTGSTRRTVPSSRMLSIPSYTRRCLQSGASSSRCGIQVSKAISGFFKGQFIACTERDIEGFTLYGIGPESAQGISRSPTHR